MTLPEKLPDHFIKAVAVNHNTSSYLELMVRSLFARHPQVSDLNYSLTIYDNSSQDDLTDLVAYAESQGFPIIQSGFNTETEHNSHGEVLQRFVLENPDPTHYLFLDSDVCFLEDFTLNIMLTELEQAPPLLVLARACLGMVLMKSLRTIGKGIRIFMMHVCTPAVLW